LRVPGIPGGFNLPAVEFHSEHGIGFPPESQLVQLSMRFSYEVGFGKMDEDGVIRFFPNNNPVIVHGRQPVYITPSELGLSYLAGMEP
jgi:hypothetical protein